MKGTLGGTGGTGQRYAAGRSIGALHEIAVSATDEKRWAQQRSGRDGGERCRQRVNQAGSTLAESVSYIL